MDVAHLVPISTGMCYWCSGIWSTGLHNCLRGKKRGVREPTNASFQVDSADFEILFHRWGFHCWKETENSTC